MTQETSSHGCPTCGARVSEFDPRCPTCAATLEELAGSTQDRDAGGGATRPIADGENGDGDGDGMATAPAIPGARSGGGAAPARYEIRSRLGAGASGEVWRAHDTMLQRDVALKLLRVDDAERALRFRREARAQARVEHEHVCRVYEVGESGGRAFIAMQLVAGPTLSRAAAEMSLEERVMVLRDAAEGLHAAHRIGLVHRDVKPSNVLVERREDGALKAYVSDFGLARDVTGAPDRTATSTAGTPHHMAPEQARGEVARFDRRTDVYGLGSTLYQVLVGRPPFVGASAREVIERLLGEDPPPPRRIDPSLPRDLETIVLKCLEKEPQRRYDTARALAEDLGRFLEGEPVAARRADWFYRLRRGAAKHRALVAVSAAALCTAAALGGAAIEARRRAGAQAQIAQQLGQEVATMDSVMRYAALLPVHDLAREKDEVRRRMEGVRARGRALGAPAAGPSRYALGRGHLALGELDQARAELTAAWASGYRTPELAAALGETLGALYKQGRDEAERLPTRALRQAREHQIEVSLRDPALAYLRQSAGSLTAYEEGLIALYEARWSDAVERARAAREQSPWRYEAWRLEGDAQAALGRERKRRGDLEAADTAYDAAAIAYDEASRIARSDVATWLGRCVLARDRMQLADQRGASPEAAKDAGLAACDEALAIEPESVPAHLRKSMISWQWGDYVLAHGGDPRPSYRACEEAAARAVQLDARSEDARRNLALALHGLGEYELAHGGDPRPALRRALEGYDDALRLDPRSVMSLTDLGDAAIALGTWELEHGIDPGPTLDRAAAALERAAEIAPTDAFPPLNLGAVFEVRADHAIKHGVDPRPLLERAIDAYRRASALNPSFAEPGDGIGSALQRRAEIERHAGADPRPTLEEAQKNVDRSLALNPNHAPAHRTTGRIAVSEAGYLIEHGADPTRAIARGRAAFERAASIDAGDAQAPRGLAELALLEAAWARRLDGAAEGRRPSAPR